MCSRFTVRHPCRSVISTEPLCSFINMTLRHGCSAINLLHIFRAPFPKNTSGGMLLNSVIYDGIFYRDMWKATPKTWGYIWYEKYCWKVCILRNILGVNIWETERQREKERETERQRETERDRERKREREGEREKRKSSYQIWKCFNMNPTRRNCSHHL